MFLMSDRLCGGLSLRVHRFLSPSIVRTSDLPSQGKPLCISSTRSTHRTFCRLTLPSCFPPKKKRDRSQSVSLMKGSLKYGRTIITHFHIIIISVRFVPLLVLSGIHHRPFPHVVVKIEWFIPLWCCRDEVCLHHVLHPLHIVIIRS